MYLLIAAFSATTRCNVTTKKAMAVDLALHWLDFIKECNTYGIIPYGTYS